MQEYCADIDYGLPGANETPSVTFKSKDDETAVTFVHDLLKKWKEKNAPLTDNASVKVYRLIETVE